MFLLVLPCCSARPELPTAAQQADAARALAVLSAADIELLPQAFAEVNARRHTRYSRLVQQIGSKMPATVARIVRQGPESDAVVVAHYESGVVASGFRGVPANTLRVDAVAEQIIETEPAHLSTRFAEDFLYETLPDTMRWNRPVQVIAISARPNAPQPVREARYYVDQGVVVGLYIRRQRRTLFFSEDTRYYLEVRPDGYGAWVPHQLHIATDVALPLRPVRSLERMMTFYAYENSESS